MVSEACPASTCVVISTSADRRLPWLPEAVNWRQSWELHKYQVVSATLQQTCPKVYIDATYCLLRLIPQWCTVTYEYSLFFFPDYCVKILMHSITLPHTLRLSDNMVLAIAGAAVGGALLLVASIGVLLCTLIMKLKLNFPTGKLQSKLHRNCLHQLDHISFMSKLSSYHCLPKPGYQHSSGYANWTHSVFISKPNVYVNSVIACSFSGWLRRSPNALFMTRKVCQSIAIVHNSIVIICGDWMVAVCNLLSFECYSGSQFIFFSHVLSLVVKYS